jgi:hypothetical protein
MKRRGGNTLVSIDDYGFLMTKAGCHYDGLHNQRNGGDLCYREAVEIGANQPPFSIEKKLT